MNNLGILIYIPFELEMPSYKNWVLCTGARGTCGKAAIGTCGTDVGTCGIVTDVGTCGTDVGTCGTVTDVGTCGTDVGSCNCTEVDAVTLP